MELTLQRRHKPTCPDRLKGLNHLTCRGRCKFRIHGTDDKGRRIRETLGTRDYARAMKLFAQRLETPAAPEQKKTVEEAIAVFLQMKANKAAETVRKYRRVMTFLADYCHRSGLRFMNDITAESLDGYVLERRRDAAGWLKEVEILRGFFTFSLKRHWCVESPADAIERQVPKE